MLKTAADAVSVQGDTKQKLIQSRRILIEKQSVF